MIFKEFIFQFYKKDELLHNRYIDEIIYFLSNMSKDKSSLISNHNLEIDFDIKDFFYYYKLVFEKNMPIEYITKKIKFLGIDFFIDKGVFIPRQDTEFIVDWILESDFIDKTINVLDLCCGSGVIANTIQYNKKTHNVYGIDSSYKAYKTSIDNAKFHGLTTKFFWRNIFRLKKEFLYNFDLIICNPPYIDKKYELDKSVKKYEPKKALYANDEGCEYYKRFILEIYPNLKLFAKIIFEIGFDQKDKLEKFLIDNKINNFYFLKDLNKNYRILVIDKDR